MGLSGQKDSSFDRDTWNRQRERYEYKPIKEEKKKEKEEEKFEFKEKAESEWKISPEVMQVILIVAALLLVAFLVNALIIAPGRQKRLSGDIHFQVEELEKDATTAVVDPLLKKALDAGEYTLAIRLYYLRILQLLDARGQIVWKREKTNRTYMLEMKGRESEVEFADTTGIFEVVRYGDRKLSKADYDAISPRFVSLINRLMR
jgi:hypothetical protein